MGVRHVRVVVSYDVIARADDELGRDDRYSPRRRHWRGAAGHVRALARRRARVTRKRPAPPAVPAPNRGRVRASVPGLPRAVPARARIRAVERAEPPHAADVEHAGDRRRGSPNIAARHVRGLHDRRRRRPRPGRQPARAAADVPRDDALGSSATGRRCAHRARSCGIHNYSDVNRFRTAGTRALMRALGCRRYWLTETGGIMSAGGWPRDGAPPDARDRVPVRARRPRAANRARVCVHVVRARDAAVGLRARRAARGRDDDAPARARDRARARPGRRTASVTIGEEIEALAGAALRSWAETQTPEGLFPNPVAAEVLAGHGGFSPPMLTYALRRAGWTAAAGRAWPMSVHPARASPFDMIGAAYATREFGAPLADYMARLRARSTRGATATEAGRGRGRDRDDRRRRAVAVARRGAADANEFVPQWARPRCGRGRRAARSAARTVGPGHPSARLPRAVGADAHAGARAPRTRPRPARSARRSRRSACWSPRRRGGLFRPRRRQRLACRR